MKWLVPGTDMGYGDAIQFARFVPRDANAARIVFAVDPTMMRLFGVLGVALVPLAKGADWAHLLAPGDGVRGPNVLAEAMASMPWWHAQNGAPPVYRPPDPPPPPAPLWSDPGIRWPPSGHPGPRVGLCWAAGMPGREVPAEALRQHLRFYAQPDVRYVSLQLGPRAGEVPELPGIAGRVRDWADTAGLVRQCDLVLTVDTAVAHLAGSLGVPTWVLVGPNADSRWGDPPAEQTPWYPSVRVIRASKDVEWLPFNPRDPKAWDRVLGHVAAALPAAFPPLGAAKTT